MAKAALREDPEPVMSAATAPSSCSADELLAEVERLYIELRTAPREQRRALEARIRFHALAFWAASTSVPDDDVRAVFERAP